MLPGELPLAATVLATFNWSIVREFLFKDIVVDAALRTLWISTLAMALGIVVGVGLAVARNLRLPFLSQFAGLYVWFFRGTPLLLQIVFIYAGLPLLGGTEIGPITIEREWLLFSPFEAALIGLALNEAAYMAEIVRAGIESIERGQMDASKALGMTNLQAMRLVILPQAMRVVIPPTGNEYIAMLKNSSLASVVSYPELLFVVRGQAARNYEVLEMLTVAAIWYLFFTSIFSILQGELEARMRPEQERRGILAALGRAFNPPGEWTGRIPGPGERR